MNTITYKFNDNLLVQDIVPALVYVNDIEVTEKIKDISLLKHLHELNEYLYQKEVSKECKRYGYKDDYKYHLIEDVVENYKNLLSFTINLKYEFIN